jgi:hypothetical protein
MYFKILLKDKLLIAIMKKGMNIANMLPLDAPKKKGITAKAIVTKDKYFVNLLIFFTYNK